MHLGEGSFSVNSMVGGTGSRLLSSVNVSFSNLKITYTTFSLVLILGRFNKENDYTKHTRKRVHAGEEEQPLLFQSYNCSSAATPFPGTKLCL